MKKLIKAKLTLLLSFLVVGSLSFAQDKVNISEFGASATNLYNSNGLEISAVKEECSINEGQKDLVFAFLTFENTTSQEMNIVFSIAQYYDNGLCNGCNEEGEYTYALTIPANSSISGDCNFEKSGTHVTLDNPNLAKEFSLVSLSITNLEIQ